MTGQFEDIVTAVSRHIGESPRSAFRVIPALYVQRLVLSAFRDQMCPAPESDGMMAVRLLERPVDETLDIGEDERLCDSKTVDNTVRPFRVIDQCSKPAEWIYVMKCCGVQALACDPCHEQHLQRPLYQRYCADCFRPFSTLADGARAVYRV
jgi:hypothetical protein